MGHAIESVAQSRGHKIILTIDKDEQSKFSSPLWQHVDVAIEFTGPGSAEANCKKVLDKNIPLICGSTGFMTNALMDEFKQKCLNGSTFFYATNFSVGVNMLFALNKKLATMMSSQPEYNAKVEETHHIHKLDKPSGTAVTLLNGLIECNPKYKDWSLVEGDALPSSSTIPVSAFREGEVFGIHEVKYTSKVDTISIRHEAFSRDGFATGAVLAAEYTREHKGFLTMSNLLGL